MSVRISALLPCILLLFPGNLFASELTLKVIDNGPGLAILGITASDHSFVFDAGHPSEDGRKVVEQVFEQSLNHNKYISFMAISHAHDDHIGSVPYIIKNYQVDALYRTGQHNPKIKQPYLDAMAAIKAAVKNKGLNDVTARSPNLYPGLSFAIGETYFKFLTGFFEPPSDWEIPLNHRSHMLNSVSLVLKVTYKKQSILIMGDALGIDDENNQFDKPWATEAYLLKRWKDELDSDVLIAGHHCDNDASSMAFLKAVSPKYVICSAGHAGNKPHQDAIARMLNADIRAANIFRTDEGDSELGLCIRKKKKSCLERAKSKEWRHQAHNIVIDPIGDDTISISLTSDNKIKIHN